MEYTIKKSIFGQMLLKQGSKTILKAPYITTYAPSADRKVRDNCPLFVVSNTKGVYDLYNAATGTNVIAGAEASQMYFSEYGAPMVFSVNNEQIYVCPNSAKIHKIAPGSTLYFSQDQHGRPSHAFVFETKNGMPKMIYKNPSFDLAATFLQSAGQPDSKLIARYPQCDTIPNPYLPLMITSKDQVYNFMATCSTRYCNDVAMGYAMEEGPEKVAGYFKTLTTLLTDVVSQKGKYTIDNIGEYLDESSQNIAQLSERHKALSDIVMENNIEADKLVATIRDLGYTIYPPKEELEPEHILVMRADRESLLSDNQRHEERIGLIKEAIDTEKSYFFEYQAIGETLAVIEKLDKVGQMVSSKYTPQYPTEQPTETVVQSEKQEIKTETKTNNQ